MSQLVVSFFQGTENVLHRGALKYGSLSGIVEPYDIIRISSNPADRDAFREHFATVPDARRRVAIQNYLADVAQEQEDFAERSEIKSDLINAAGMVPSGGVVAAGVSALVAANPVAPFLLAGGLLALAIFGLGKAYLRNRAQRHKSIAQRIKRLEASLACPI